MCKNLFLLLQKLWVTILPRQCTRLFEDGAGKVFDAFCLVRGESLLELFEAKNVYEYLEKVQTDHCFKNHLVVICLPITS